MLDIKNEIRELDEINTQESINMIGDIIHKEKQLDQYLKQSAI